MRVRGFEGSRVRGFEDLKVRKVRKVRRVGTVEGERSPSAVRRSPFAVAVSR